MHNLICILFFDIPLQNYQRSKFKKYYLFHRHLFVSGKKYEITFGHSKFNHLRIYL